MIVGDYSLDDFLVFFNVLKTGENESRYGLFLFFIEDEIYPLKGSDYNISEGIGYLKSLSSKVGNCRFEGLDFSESDECLINEIIKSKGLMRESLLSDIEDGGMGIVLSTQEMLNVGCYVFYAPINENEECLIYSRNYGKDPKRTIIKRGSVGRVVEELNKIENI